MRPWRALAAIVGEARSVELAESLLRTGGSQAIAGAAALLRVVSPKDPGTRDRIRDALWSSIRRGGDHPYIESVVVTATDYSNPAAVVEQLLDEPTLPGRLLLLIPLRTATSARWPSRRAEVLDRVIEALDDPNDRARDAAVAWLSERIGELDAPERAQVRLAAEQAVRRRGTGLPLLAELVGSDAALDIVLHDARREPVARAILTDGVTLVDEKWSERTEPLLEVVIAALESQDWQLKRAGLTVLTRHANSIPRDAGPRLEAVLTTLQGEYALKADAEVALLRIRDEMRRTDTGPLLQILTEGEESTQLEAISQLLSLRTPDAVRPLVRVWAQWIALGGRSGLVEGAAQKIRQSSDAILPLLDQLDEGLPRDDRLETTLRDQAVPREYRDLIPYILGDRQLSRQQAYRLKEWLTRSGTVDGSELNDPSSAAAREARSLAAALLSETYEKELRSREARMRQRVSRLLAEMSDRRFFDQEESFRAIAGELEKHAVPILSRRLEQEDDSVIRENIARVLGNLGGREAVDVLARAVVGEDRRRENRQHLLAQYYLEPSKTRSDEAARILHDAAVEAKRTLRLLQVLNGVFFLVGIAILIGGVLVAFTANSQTAQVIGGATGLAGFVGIVLQIVREPLIRIQNAVTRLVQVETAFTSFIWELNLNGTYIQSQYVAEGVLADDEIAATVERIEGAMHLAMDLVARYTQEDRGVPLPRIVSLVPAAGPPGTPVNVYGDWLRGVGDRAAKKSARVAVNHVPVAVADAVFGDSAVHFTLPAQLPGQANAGDAVWVSLVVGGYETNAMPFRVT